LLSEGFGISDVLDALSEGGSVFNDSLSGVINGSLGDGHEVGVSGKLVGFGLVGIGDGLKHFGSDGGEFLSESTEHFGVSEIGEFEEGFDDSTVFGGFKGLIDFLERSLDLGDLDKSWGSGVKTGKEFHALINSIDGHVGFFNKLDVLGMRRGSLHGGGVHLSKSVDNELFVSGNLLLEGGLKWVEDVVKAGGSHGDIRLGMSNSLSDGSFPSVVLSKLDVVVLSVNINLELVVSKEILESLDEVFNW
jgi:hypothetical protein